MKGGLATTNTNSSSYLTFRGIGSGKRPSLACSGGNMTVTVSPVSIRSLTVTSSPFNRIYPPLNLISVNARFEISHLLRNSRNKEPESSSVTDQVKEKF
ncbi:Uncharacterised protein [Chlamydia trachomatis]|nr:Uncharacterised protein [Chlamydia trachomatis]